MTALSTLAKLQIASLSRCEIRSTVQKGVFRAAEVEEDDRDTRKPRVYFPPKEEAVDLARWSPKFQQHSLFHR